MNPEIDCVQDRAVASARAADGQRAIPVSRAEVGSADSTAVPGLLDLAGICGQAAPESLPRWLREVLAGAAADLLRSPDPARAREAIGARFGRRPDEVLLTTGATEAYSLLVRAVRPRRAAVVHPQATAADTVLLRADVPVEHVILDEADGFRLDPAAVPDDADLVLVANPMNPTGGLTGADVLRRLSRPGRVLVVDERLLDAVPGERATLAARSGSEPAGDVVVLRGMPSLWPLVGVRAGHLLGSAALIERLGALQPGCPLSAPAISLLEAANAPAAAAAAATAAERLVADRAYLLDQIRQLPGIRTVGSPRSTVLVARVRDGRRLRSRLAETGRPVQLLPAVPGLGPDYVRIPVRDHLATARLVATLEATLR